jgi:hypothetical protein
MGDSVTVSHKINDTPELNILTAHFPLMKVEAHCSLRLGQVWRNMENGRPRLLRWPSTALNSVILAAVAYLKIF